LHFVRSPSTFPGSGTVTPSGSFDDVLRYISCGAQFEVTNVNEYMSVTLSTVFNYKFSILSQNAYFLPLQQLCCSAG